MRCRKKCRSRYIFIYEFLFTATTISTELLHWTYSGQGGEVYTKGLQRNLRSFCDPAYCCCEEWNWESQKIPDPLSSNKSTSGGPASLQIYASDSCVWIEVSFEGKPKLQFEQTAKQKQALSRCWLHCFSVAFVLISCYTIFNNKYLTVKGVSYHNSGHIMDDNWH